MKVINVEQGTEEWQRERLACVTGTRIKSAVGAKYSSVTNEWTLGDKKIQATLLYALVSERQSDVVIDTYCSPKMERGNELEPLSIEAASIKRGVTFESIGMLQCDWHPRFKFSPDAICVEDGVVVGGYETKSKEGGKHIEYTLKNEIPAEHFWQVIGPMIMDDSVQWWDFGHFDDRNYINNLFIKRITRKEVNTLVLQARGILKNFLRDVDMADKQIKRNNEDFI